MVQKGSVAVSGVSLTITAVEAGRFSVALIPTTWTGTTFAGMSVGSKVNIETDVIGKYVRRWIAQTHAAPAAGLTRQALKELGLA